MKREVRKAPGAKKPLKVQDKGRVQVTPTKKALLMPQSEITIPPFSKAAHQEAYGLLDRLRDGEMLELPHSRPMPSIGQRCHELRIQDEKIIHRVIYYLDLDAVVVLEVFVKKTQATPQHVIKISQTRLARYQAARAEAQRLARKSR